MNQKMRELSAAIKSKFEAAREAQSGGDAEKAALIMDECDVLQKSYDLEKKIYEREKSLVPDEPDPAPGKAPSGFALLAKCLRNQPFTEEEWGRISLTPEVSKALVSGGNAANGENYLIPEDVDHTIRELRKTYVSAKDIVTVMPTATLSGSFTFEAEMPAGLISFDDGSEVPAGAEPKFKNLKYTIALKGMIIPVSNLLTAVEAGGLITYLNQWFVKNAIITENAAIFTALKKDKTPVELAGMDALRKSLNLDLDPSCLLDGVIVTNQTGFDLMDSEKDGDGRGMLQPDPGSTTGKLFKGLGVKVFPDAQLPNVSGKAPVFYGATRAGVYFMEFQSLLFASSSHAGFGKNQTQMRVIEGFDVIQADKAAYQYGLLSAPVSGGA